MKYLKWPERVSHLAGVPQKMEPNHSLYSDLVCNMAKIATIKIRALFVITYLRLSPTPG